MSIILINPAVFRHKDLPALAAEARRQVVDEFRRVEDWAGNVNGKLILLSDHQNLDNRDPAAGGAHAAESISYDNTSSGLAADEVQAAIDEVVSDAITDHQDLTNRNPATGGAHDADVVDYDNTTSGLTATDVQAAIDEVKGDIVTDHQNLTNRNPATGTAHDADVVAYDNTSSGLTATDVQAAIDEVAGGSSSAEYGFGGMYTYPASSTDNTSLVAGEWRKLNFTSMANMEYHNVLGYASGYLKPNISGTLYHPTSWPKGKGLLTAHLSFLVDTAEDVVFGFWDDSTGGANTRYKQLAQLYCGSTTQVYHVSFSQYVPVESITGFGYYVMAYCASSITFKLRAGVFTLEWE